MMLAQILWGTEIPVDISNVPVLFFGIIILTGYIYLARSIYRLPVALYLGVRSSVYELTVSTRWHRNKLDALNSNSSYIRFRWFQKVAITFYMYLIIVLVWMLVFPLNTLSFERNSRVWHQIQEIETDVFGVSEPNLTVELCRILDRVGLIAISVLATIPRLKSLYTQIGIIGIGFMLVVFVFSGSFSAIVKDMLSQQEEKSSSSSRYDRVEVKTSQSDPLYVEFVNKNDYPLLQVEVKNVVTVQDVYP